MSLARVCVVYVVKEVSSFRGLRHLMGMARLNYSSRKIQKGCKTVQARTQPFTEGGSNLCTTVLWQSTHPSRGVWGHDPPEKC